jgi:Secretion system C-terminal sorting domain
MKSFFISVFIFTFSVLLNGQIELDFYAGNLGVSSPALHKNNDYLFVTTENFLARSKDGDTFEPLIKNKSGYLLVNENKLYYLFFKKGFKKSLLFSDDNGANWIENPLPHSNIDAQSFQYKNGLLAIASYSQFILHSKDNGATWDSTYYTDFAYEYPSIENNIYTVIGTRLYKINQSTKDSVFLDLKPYIKSDNVRQLVVFDNMIFIRNFSNVLVINKEIDQILSNVSNHILHFDIIDNNLYNVSLSDVKTYNKNSNIWTTVLPTNNFQRIYSYMKFNGNSYVADNNDRLYKIDAGNKISISGQGIDREKIYNVKIGEDFIVTQNRNKISIYRPATNSWENLFESDLSYNYEDIVTNKKQMIAYLDIYNYKLRVSIDKGINWTIKNLPINIDPFGPPLTNFVLKSFDDLIVLTNGYDNYISSDFGNSWRHVAQGHDNNIVQFKGKYYGGAYSSTFTSSDLSTFTVTPNAYSTSLYHTSENYIFLYQRLKDDYKILMSEDGSTWTDVSNSTTWYLGSEGYYFYEKDQYVYAIQNYGTYRLNLNEKEAGWEIVDNYSYLGNIFEFDGKLLAAQSGIYKIFLGESSLVKTQFNDVNWINENGDKIFLSKKAKQYNGTLYYEVLIEKSNNIVLYTGTYVTEENGKLRVLKNNEENIFIDYNLSINSVVNISNDAKIKLLSTENIENNQNLKLNKYNFLLSENGEIKDLTYTNLIGDKESFFLKDLLPKYNISEKISCIYLNQDLLISNGEVCQSTSSTTEVENKLMLYPNPATQILNIDPTQKGKYYIKLFSSTGTQIQTVQFIDNTKLTLTEFQSGIYFIHLFDEKNKEIYHSRFVKM